MTHDSNTVKPLSSLRCGPDVVGNTIRCADCVEPASKRGFKLWFKFSLALVLAIGIAILEGPGTLLEEPLRNQLERDLEAGESVDAENAPELLLMHD